MCYIRVVLLLVSSGMVMFLFRLPPFARFSFFSGLFLFKLVDWSCLLCGAVFGLFFLFLPSLRFESCLVRDGSLLWVNRFVLFWFNGLYLWLRRDLLNTLGRGLRKISIFALPQVGFVLVFLALWLRVLFFFSSYAGSVIWYPLCRDMWHNSVCEQVVWELEFPYGSSLFAEGSGLLMVPTGISLLCRFFLCFKLSFQLVLFGSFKTLL